VYAQGATQAAADTAIRSTLQAYRTAPAATEDAAAEAVLAQVEAAHADVDVIAEELVAWFALGEHDVAGGSDGSNANSTGDVMTIRPPGSAGRAAAP